MIEHEIVLKGDAVVKRMSYRTPERLQASLRKEVDLMLTLGIIEPSKSEWCHPVVLVPKKDGTLRFCIDFRYLNSVSKFDCYPTPRISDLIDRLGQSKYLTTIDLAKGYWQIPLTLQSRELTAFISGYFPLAFMGLQPLSRDSWTRYCMVCLLRPLI